MFLARSDSGVVDRPQSLVNLAEVVNDVAPALRALAEKAGIECQIANPPALWLKGYESMLFRLLFNLGENAIKYTPAGGQVGVHLYEDGSWAVLEVRDTGPGIPLDEQAQIFDRFYRADRARSRGGSGLGLALARSIAVVHGGRIEIEGTSGQGSCFRVRLPTAEI